MELQIKNLSKTYSNGVRALNNVTLTVTKGMYGLLGPNGAGKSTLMRTIATLQEPDNGTVFLDELNILEDKMATRRILGYLPQEFGVYSGVTAADLLNHMALIKGIINKKERNELVNVLLEQTNLYEHRKKKLGTFSGGMKQRFGIAQALIGEPLLIIVDEPTAGLDPVERNRFLNLLGEIGEDIVVILSTHIVDDVRELCTKMAIINRGEVLFEGKPKDAIQKLDGKVWEKTISKHELRTYKEKHTLISSKLTEGKPLIHILNDTRPDDSFVPVGAGLDDVYFTEIFHAEEQLESEQ